MYSKAVAVHTAQQFLATKQTTNTTF